MDIEHLKTKKHPGDGKDLTQLDYLIDDEKVRLKVGDTALTTLGVRDQNLARTFRPLVSSIYAELNDQDANLEEISIDSRGAEVGEGYIIYNFDQVKDKIN
ncbi:MAG: hypothetical protein ABEJ24_02010 [Candidatus Magasanikbacteria bacterium]